jgi:hypothetical protein
MCFVGVGLEQNTVFFSFNALTPGLNPFAQRCLTIFFTGDFASWTVHFGNICVINQQIHQLFIQFINYVWYLLHVSALHCHPQRAFLVPSDRCSIEEQSIEYCGWACCVLWRGAFHAPLHYTQHTVMRYCEECSGTSLPTYLGQPIAPIFKVKNSKNSWYSFLEFLTLECGTYRLSRNVGKELALCAA